MDGKLFRKQILGAYTKLKNIMINRENLSRIIRVEGMFYLIRRTLYFIIGQVMGVIAYPVCRIMKVKFIPVYTSVIGHLAGEVDCYLKEGILGLRPSYRAVLLAPRKDTANSHLLGYWKKYICVITNPMMCFLLGPLRRSTLVRYDIEKYFIGDYKTVAFPRIQALYMGRPPLLSLSDLDRKRGWAVLRDAGIPDDSWFVCVHCRKGGRISHKQGQTLRDADIKSYIPAMEEIVKRGGWVLRMGDAFMEPIPAMKNVIDYAHMSIKSDWMDIFLCASCKLFLGSNSGLTNLAMVFGTPTAVTNTSGPVSAVLPYGPDDIGIPKLVWSMREGRYLSFKEILSSPIGNFREDHLFASYGLRVVENSPDDIIEIMIERIDRLEGKLKYSDADERLQERFKSLMNPTHFSYGSASRIGMDFLRKYEHLLN